MEGIADLTQEDDITRVISTLYASTQRARATDIRQAKSGMEFYRGNHYGYMQLFGSGVMTSSQQFSNLYRRKVLLASVLIEAKRNMILAADPKIIIAPTVDPSNPPQAKKIALVTEALLEKVFSKEDFDTKKGSAILSGLIEHTSYFSLWHDLLGIHIDVLRFEDVIVPPRLKDISKSPFVGRRFSTTIGALRADPSYKNIDKLGGSSSANLSLTDDLDTTSKDINQSFEEVKMPIKDMNHVDPIEWEFLFQLDSKSLKFLKNLSKTNKSYRWINKKKIGDRIMRVITVCENIVIKDKYYNSDNYYLYPVVPVGDSLTGPAFFARAISANKALDNTVSLIEEYMAYAIKYRILVDSQTTMSPPNNSMGGMVYYEGMNPPTELVHSDVSPGVFTMLNWYPTIMQTLLAISPSSMGDIPNADKAFKAIESQKMQDNFNTKPMITSFANTLRKLGEGIVSLMASNYQLMNTVYTDTDGIHEVKIVGENFAKATPTLMDSEDQDNLIVIKDNFPVEIRVAQGLDYTEASMQNTLLKLAQTQAPQDPIVPIEAYLDITNQGPLMAKIKQAKEEAQKNQAQSPQTAGAAPQGGVPPHTHTATGETVPAGTPPQIAPTSPGIIAPKGPEGGPQQAPAPQMPAQIPQGQSSPAPVAPQGVEGSLVSPKPGSIAPQVLSNIQKILANGGKL